jgi:hypothetical protein
LTVKPQLGLLLPLLLVLDRNWSVFTWSSVFTALLVALSAAVFGVESWRAYLGETAAYQRFVMMDGDGIFPFMMPTVFGSVRAFNFFSSMHGVPLTSDVALLVQAPVTAAALAVVVWLLYRERDPLRRAFVVTCGTFLITPYAFNYDMGALCVCAAVLAGQPAERPRGQIFVFSVALVAAIAGAVTHLSRVGLPITPVVLAAGLAVVLAASTRWGVAGEGTLPTQSRA